MPQGDHVPDALSVHEFLSSKAHVSPQVGLLGDKSKQRTTRLSSGLAQWSKRLDFEPFRLIVQGTAGSGKTQLALNELREAYAVKKTAMYICFNRPLVDSVKLSAPEPNNCMTFHELAKLLAKQNGLKIDFKEEGIFKKLEDFFITNISQLENQLDVLVVDEGQDFEESWANALLKMVKPKGRIIWLEDESQRLYDRDGVKWGEQWVKISSPMNYRSPQRIVNMINSLELTDTFLESGNGFRGMIPATYAYPEGYEKEGTIQALEDLINEGYSPQSIAILTFRGVKSSKLLHQNIKELAGIHLKKFQDFSDSGEAIWTEGELLIDSIFRFKGQCADAVILTEIDFDEYSENVKRRLFVGLTRARLMVSLVVSERVGQFLDEML
jgi:superfamily I DNA and RNA helicase